MGASWQHFTGILEIFFFLQKVVSQKKTFFRYIYTALIYTTYIYIRTSYCKKLCTFLCNNYVKSTDVQHIDSTKYLTKESRNSLFSCKNSVKSPDLVPNQMITLILCFDAFLWRIPWNQFEYTKIIIWFDEKFGRSSYSFDFAFWIIWFDGKNTRILFFFFFFSRKILHPVILYITCDRISLFDEDESQY